MRPGPKQFVGMLLLVTFVILYAFFAMIIGSAMADRGLATQLAFFAVAGVIWVVPAGIIVWWMAKTSRN